MCPNIHVRYYSLLKLGEGKLYSLLKLGALMRVNFKLSGKLSTLIPYRS